MDTGNEGNCCHSKKSQVVIATKDITKMPGVERDKFEEILTQNDMIIDDMTKMNGKKSLTKMLQQQQLDEEICCNDSVERVNCRLDRSILKRRRQSIERPSFTNLEYEQLRLECTLLQDKQKSLQDDNESLRMVNKILRSNYDMLKERLELVQSEHQLRLTQLDHATQILKSASTNKRVHSNQYDDCLESSASNKRRRFEGNGRDNDLQIVLRTSCASTEFSSDASNSSGNDRCTSETEDSEHSDTMDNDVNGTEDSDHFNSNDEDMNGTDSEDDDVEFIPTISEPISIDSSDISDVNDDSAADEENEDGRSENLDNDSCADESLSDDFLKPLSEYSIVKIPLNVSQNQTPKRDPAE
ncbi:kinesin-related protein 4-like isoform X1 [Bradysia coprophila]|uniref:kinesin-related protein 4-like isoform X1 n=1 Tax=Bradysia coprophila TaxID=38358 RepID=UPI00187D917C|nr:kinesin-related protein 4-like isoform X1 [Bradysia coprophila]